MDDLLALSLMIMGIAIGVLLVIWGVMSLYFHIRNKKRHQAAAERERARKEAEAAAQENPDPSENNE